MSSVRIVERFDVLKQTQSGLFSGFELFSLHQLRFEGGEEAFYRGIVPAVAFSAHAALDVGFFELISEKVSGVLAAAVTMEEKVVFVQAFSFFVLLQILRCQAMRSCHFQRGLN